MKLGKRCVVEEHVSFDVQPQGGKLKETIVGDDSHIRSHTVMYAGNVIGKHFQTGHGALIREANVIGDDVSVGSHSVVEHHVKIGNGVRIHSQAFVPEFCVLKDGCWIGPNVVLTNALYPKSKNAKKELKGVVVEENAKAGANSTLLPGVVIGKNSLIGAGSVVVKDIPPNSVAVGCPARVIKKISELKAYG